MPFKIVEWEVLTARNPPHGRILDLGCGPGLQTHLLGRRASAVGIDVDEEAIRFARDTSSLLGPRSDATFVASPIEDAQLPRDSFDVVYSFSVLEHIPNWQVALGELHRVLRPGGRLVMSTDWLAGVEPSLRARHRLDHSVQQYFSPEALGRALQEAGFADVQVEPLFRSTYALHLFEKGIRRRFKPSLISWVQQTRRLRREEKRAPKHPGIFLVATARKMTPGDPPTR